MKSIEMCRTVILTYTLPCGFIVVVGLRPICLLPRGQRPPKYKYKIHSTEPVVASSISKRIASWFLKRLVDLSLELSYTLVRVV